MIVKEFQPLCEKESEEYIEYCKAKTGEFFVNEIDFYDNTCQVPFDIPNDTIPGRIVS